MEDTQDLLDDITQALEVCPVCVCVCVCHNMFLYTILYYRYLKYKPILRKSLDCYIAIYIIINNWLARSTYSVINNWLARSTYSVMMTKQLRYIARAYYYNILRVDPQGLSPFTACRLIALDKNPGVRPIGICETVRRIVSKAVLYVIKDDIQHATGSIQLCAGQIAGIEAAIHATCLQFSSPDTEGVLLVDASNAFNSLNRQTALHNIQVLCPAIATILINTYRDSSQLFMDGNTIYSQEGTTQGDPLAMPMYALATLPLVHRLNDFDNSIGQLWYADDASATGRLDQLRTWWDRLTTIGPAYGYHPNASKTWLVTKEAHLQDASTIFHGSNVNITAEGRPYLGAALGTESYISRYVSQKVQQWCSDLSMLSDIAATQPHAAHAALTHGFSSKWTFLTRTIPCIGHLLQPLEDTLRQKFIPSLTGRPPPNDMERQLLALPARLGGIGLTDPTNTNSEHSASYNVSHPLISHIMQGQYTYPSIVKEEQRTAKAVNNRSRHRQLKEDASNLFNSLPSSLQKAMTLAQEKGASSWLTALPIDEHGFALHKTAFRDALALRYGWLPPHLPTSCACGKTFSLEHILSCPKGGFPSIRHNEIRDVTAMLLTEVCHDVAVEPHLQPLNGETFPRRSANTEDGARLDIVASGFWGGRFEKTYYDVRVFNPHAASNQHSEQSAVYRRHELLKRNAYEQRVREIEHASFTPLVMSLTGGLGPAATTTYKRLGSLLATKWDQSYECVMAWLRCRLSFSLLRSSIMCLRGARSSRGHVGQCPIPIDVITSEALVAH